MAIELKSVLLNPKLRLAFKALIFAALLSLVRAGDFGLVPILVFLTGSLILYLKPLFRTLELIYPLVILLILALMIVRTLMGGVYWFLPVIYFSALFYWVLGIKDLAFVGRVSWNHVLVLSLAYPALLLFFYHNQESFWWKAAALFVALLVLLRYLLSRRLVSWLLAFLMLEAVWAVSLLPIGFLSSANLAIIFYFALSDIAFHKYSIGDLRKKRILTGITVAALLALAVLAFSRWSL